MYDSQGRERNFARLPPFPESAAMPATADSTATANANDADTGSAPSDPSLKIATPTMIFDKTRRFMECSILTLDCTFNFGAVAIPGHRTTTFWDQAIASFESEGFQIDRKYRFQIILRLTDPLATSRLVRKQ